MGASSSSPGGGSTPSSTNAGYNPSGKFGCSVCSVKGMTSPSALNDHMGGRKHQNNLTRDTMSAVEYETNSDGTAKILKSLNNEHPSYVRFINVSRRPVDIYWIDFRGQPDKYKQLLPTQFLDVNTYTSHPWIFKDSVTQERFMINNSPVFRGPPEAPTRIQLNYPIRIHFNITPPLRDLRTNALLALVEILRDVRLVSHLELPKTLELELKQAITALRPR